MIYNETLIITSSVSLKLSSRVGMETEVSLPVRISDPRYTVLIKNRCLFW